MENTKKERLLEIFFRGLRGEDLSVQRLADEYKVSTKSITRNLNDLKAFLSNHRELVGNTELQYSYQSKSYRLYMDEFLTNKELFALVEVMIGARAFSKMELLALTDKLKRFTTAEDRDKLNELIRKELYHYSEVKHDYESVQATLWQLHHWFESVLDAVDEQFEMRINGCNAYLYVRSKKSLCCALVYGRVGNVWKELAIRQIFSNSDIPYEILSEVRDEHKNNITEEFRKVLLNYKKGTEEDMKDGTKKALQTTLNVAANGGSIMDVFSVVIKCVFTENPRFKAILRPRMLV